MKKLLVLVSSVVFLIMLLGSITVSAVPANGLELHWRQPDGTPITVRAFGDEFFLRIESLDGFTLIQDSETGFFYYATLNSDGSDFESTGIVHRGDSASIPLIARGIILPPRGLELSEEHVQRQRNERRAYLFGEHDDDVSFAPFAQDFAPLDSRGVQVINGITIVIDFPATDYYPAVKVIDTLLHPDSPTFDPWSPDAKFFADMFYCEDYCLDFCITYCEIICGSHYDCVGYCLYYCPGGCCLYFCIDSCIIHCEIYCGDYCVGTCLDFCTGHCTGHCRNIALAKALAEIYNFLNKPGYSGYGNNGSIRDFFIDMSGGRVEYNNRVFHYTARYSKIHYAGLRAPAGSRALANEALLWLRDNDANFRNYLPQLTRMNNPLFFTDIIPLNLFFAGEYYGSLPSSLWPHAAPLRGSNQININGVTFNGIQITGIRHTLNLGTFAHETGHLVFGFDDLYNTRRPEYHIGWYCLMGSGNWAGTNPIPISAYWRYWIGWVEPIVLNENPNDSVITPEINALNPHVFYTLSNDEFFLIEYIQRKGRYEHFPSEGIVIYHIDRNGNNLNPRNGQNPRVRIVSADPTRVGGRSIAFPWVEGGNNRFTPTSNPNSNLWDGTSSGLSLTNITATGSFIFRNYNTDMDITDAFTDPLFLEAVREITGREEYEAILLSDVWDIEELDVNSRDIQSLAGIEYFTALRTLWVLFNELTELDLSFNTNLEFLYASYNNLETLNVSSNERLELLDVQNNRLTELDVSFNTNLEYLDVYRNQLTELDVSSNERLEWLSVSHNRLTELDVSSNTNLRLLHVSHNYLENLDVSFNTNLMNLNVVFNYMRSRDCVIGWHGIRGFSFFNQRQSLSSITLSVPDLEYDAINERITYSMVDLSIIRTGGVRSHFPIQINRRDSFNTILASINNTIVVDDLGYGTFLVSANNGHEVDNFGLDEHIEIIIMSCLFYREIMTYLIVTPEMLGFMDITYAFTCANFLAAVRGIIGKPTGPIFKDDVKYITHLNVRFQNISSLSGIEYFTGLTWLDCSWNQLTYLDVTNNFALVRLDSSRNQLTELDLTNNPALQHLNCSENQLMALDVSNNPALIALYGCFNQLTELDVSNNPALSLIFCIGNQLTELDLTNNSALAILSCSWNYLVELDVSNNPELNFIDVSFNLMPSIESVIGWQELGLELNRTFGFHPQRQRIF